MATLPVPYSHKFLLNSSLSSLEDIRDEKADELINLQRTKFSLMAQIEYLQSLIDEETKTLEGNS